MNSEMIRDVKGRVIGWLDTLHNGDIMVKDYAGRVLGYYRKAQDMTTEYAGRFLNYGNTCVSLIYRQNP